MTEQELKRLHRADLVEMMLDLSKENEILRTQLDKAQKNLANRTITIEQSGSLAEAALQLNGVFAAAQAACDQYALNLRQRMENQEAICEQMERQAQEKCDQMLAEAQMQANARRQEADAYLADVQKQADDYKAKAEQAVQEVVNSYSWLSQVLK